MLSKKDKRYQLLTDVAFHMSMLMVGIIGFFILLVVINEMGYLQAW